jgi:BirA family biotin operon repressor/biotin-[acetyl-CoA-carboxylase] ligase
VIAWRLHEFEELPSTSDFCVERAKAGEAEGLAVFAARQSAGRGSRGREWLSPAGNMALSVLIRPALAPAKASIFPLLAGLAVAEAAREALPPGVAPMLKWPNDVLLAGKKCAGLLIDAAPGQGRIEWMVIGMGINVAYAPEVSGRETTCLAAHGARAAAPEVARAVLEKLSRGLEILARSGPSVIIMAWLEHAHPIGTELEVKSPHYHAVGIFEGLTPAGELLLRVEDRIETVSTGEILLREGRA